jgi:outer membrane protein assembly factor BamE
MRTIPWTYIKPEQPGPPSPRRVARPVDRLSEVALRVATRTNNRIIAGAVLLACATMVAGCGSVTDYFPGFLTPYRPDIQQGNVITSDMVDQLRPGMTKDQVRFMLGTPLLADVFHQDRWDYLYYLNPRIGERQHRNLVVYFKDSRLDHFSSDAMPPESMADNLILGNKWKDKPVSLPPKEPAPQVTLPAPK